MIYVSDEWFTELSEGSIYDEWHEVIGSGTEYTVLSPGDRVAMADGAYIEILDCAVSTGDSGNDSSLVMLLVYGDSTALFTGDARMGVTPDIDILKVGHHGSRDATDAVFLASATPETAVISAGRGNSYGHPHSEVLTLLEDCGADIYRTDLHGAVTVMIDKDGDHEVITFMEDDQ